MSHFSVVKGIKITDEECLVTALKELGYDAIVVKNEADKLKSYRFSQDGESVALKDYCDSDYQDQFAHVIVPRKQIGRAANDLGFRWNGASYEAIISAYDQSTKINEGFQGRLQAHYVRAFTSKLARQMGANIIVSTTDPWSFEIEVNPGVASKARTHLSQLRKVQTQAKSTVKA